MTTRRTRTRTRTTSPGSSHGKTCVQARNPSLRRNRRHRPARRINLQTRASVIELAPGATQIGKSFLLDCAIGREEDKNCDDGRSLYLG